MRTASGSLHQTTRQDTDLQGVRVGARQSSIPGPGESIMLWASALSMGWQSTTFGSGVVVDRQAR